MTDVKLFFRFSKLLFPYRRKWIYILILSGAGAVASLINPYLAKFAVDDGILAGNFKTFIVLALSGGAIFIVTSLFGTVARYLEKSVRLSVGFDLGKKVFDSFQRFSFGWFQARSTGEQIYSIEHDVGNAAEFVTETPPRMLAIAPRILLITAIVFYLNWRMALLSAGLSVFMYLPSYYVSRKARILWERLTDLSKGMLEFLEEAFSNIGLIKAFGRESATSKRYFELLSESMAVEIKETKAELANHVAGEGATLLVAGLISLYGGYLVIQGGMTPGSLTAIMVYLRQLVDLHGEAAETFRSTAIGLVSCRRIAEILDETSVVVEAVDARPLKFEKGEVAFKNVSFGYRTGDCVLKDLSFNIAGGSRIALIGPSGCGKSTMLMTLLRMYNVWGGDILIDSQDVRGVTLSSLRDGIGIALQEPLLWNAGIEENIRYGRENATHADILEAARLSGVDEFAGKLSRGYETAVGEGGCRLSEGQKQKLAIARAIVKAPKILILDEAMSSMDSASEKMILKNIKERVTHSTIIIVSHRLSAVEEMDLVYHFQSPDRMTVADLKDASDDPRFVALFAGQHGA